MTLTTNGKNYIAQKFGSSNCYIATGLNWSYLGTDNITYNETGGTAQIVSRLIMASLVQSVTIGGITYTYSMLKANNNNTDLILSDAQWIAQNDGSPSGEAQYCYIAPTIKYKCVNGVCISDNGDGTGTFPDPTCGGTCIPTPVIKYKCVNGVCVSDNGDGTGTFPDPTCGGTCIPPVAEAGFSGLLIAGLLIGLIYSSIKNRKVQPSIFIRD